MRGFLDRLYKASGVLAAACLLAILGIIVAQMAMRWMSIPFPGSNQYAGYLMAASSFLAFAYALNSAAHIRVSILISALGSKSYYLELWCMLIGCLASSYLTWFAFKSIYWAVKFHEVSQGQDPTPIWIVQLPVAFGALLLTICFFDNLFSLITKGRDNIRKEQLKGPEL